ncbi:GNAT family N-acetyltransferase [Kosakonia sp. S58]|uniref:GNAT family N-acetyltransferase n=1 Tax=unclassified Kosakonia TaxID=2632876 RepID=UPI0019079EDC|nr:MULTISPECIES: GNAT family N-acetyltransferase [unclassified Kosakonia]MBK0079838.1 GNAT family N-acetyltransferase [Kosakonia sp. S57]MBK0086652.1 GNAT family N-acetyltransferase [Kosakonia sp. S58]
MIEYEIISATQAHQCLPELGDVLQSCVKDGASVGFTDPYDRRAIDRFWKDKIYSLASHDCELLIARDNGFLAATVIINYCGIPNGRHRAEISKLLVHPQARRQGIARELMHRAEKRTWEKGISLLVLDTRSGDVASDLYISQGWQIAGEIPYYAKSTENRLHSTTFMYKINDSGD